MHWDGDTAFFLLALFLILLLYMLGGNEFGYFWSQTMYILLFLDGFMYDGYYTTGLRE